MPAARAKIATVRELFEGAIYKVPSYQRDFCWQEKHIEMLFNDLFHAFEDISAEEGGNSEYFLGTIVTQVEENSPYDWLVDGQQRTTCLCLILVSLGLRCQEPIRSGLLNLVRRPKGYAVDAEGYLTAFGHLLGDEKIKSRGPLPKARKTTEAMSEAFTLIDKEVSENLTDTDFVQHFALWLLDNVFVALIEDTDPDDDQRLFDRINTRGLPLSEADRFRSKCLASIPAGGGRKLATTTAWSKVRADAQRVVKSRRVDPIDAERTLLIDWLIGRFAMAVDKKSIDDVAKEIKRDPYQFADSTLRGQLPQEEEALVNELSNGFFRWVDRAGDVFRAQEHFSVELAGFRTAKLIKLNYARPLAAAINNRSNIERAQNLCIVARFIDVAAARRIWNSDWRSTAEIDKLLLSALPYVRTKTGDDLAMSLRGLLADAPDFTAAAAPRFKLSQRPLLTYLFNRLALHLETLSTQKHRAAHFFVGSGKAKMEIEHLMGDDFHAYQDGFDQDFSLFEEWRQRLGALTILPKSLNAELQTMNYSTKLISYAQQNALARSLCQQCYDHRFRFEGLRRSDELKLKPMLTISPQTIAEREECYAALANDLWRISGISQDV